MSKVVSSTKRQNTIKSILKIALSITFSFILTLVMLAGTPGIASADLISALKSEVAYSSKYSDLQENSAPPDCQGGSCDEELNKKETLSSNVQQTNNNCPGPRCNPGEPDCQLGDCLQTQSTVPTGVALDPGEPDCQGLSGCE